MRVRVATTSERPEALPRLPFVPLGHGTHQQAGIEAKLVSHFYEIAGREFMGEWYRRELDYPKRLINTAPEETGAENPFWRCRQCDGLEHERMAGIYWCQKCAREKREERAKAFYDSPEEQARRAAADAAPRSDTGLIDKPFTGRLRESASSKRRRARQGSGDEEEA